MPIIKNNEVKIYYNFIELDASKPTIVLLNGLSQSTDSWNLVLPNLKKLGMNILLHDFRGQLKSDKPDIPYTFKMHFDDLNVILRKLDIKNIHLVGTSYGGILAMKVASELKKKVMSLCLFNTERKPDKSLRMYFKGLINNYSVNKNNAILGSYFQGIADGFSEEHINKNWSEFLKRAELLKTLPEDFYIGLLNIFKNLEKDEYITYEEILNITCPTLLMWSENDILAKRSYMELIHKEIPFSEFAIIPEAGHNVFFEKPEILSTMITGFILKNENS